MSHILRYHIPPEYSEKRIPEIVDYCRRTGCGEVLLFTTSYDGEPSFLPLEEVARRAGVMQDHARVLRQAGIEVSVNVLQTIGHVYYPEPETEDLRFQRRVGFDGSESRAGACPLCPRLRKYQQEAYALYARVKPHILFVDDDFRSVLCEGPTCLCPLHLQAISQELGREVTFDELREHLMREGFTHDDQIRNAFDKVQKQAWVSFAAIIGDSVRGVSPETRLGLMTAVYPAGAFGMDWQEILDALAGPEHRPLLRPQIAGYNDHHDLHIVPQLWQNPIIVRNLLGRSVEYFCEIENHTYTSWAKSTTMSIEAVSWCLLNGFENPVLSIFDMYGSPLAECEDLIRSLENHKAWFSALTDLCKDGKPSQGVAMPVAKSLCEVRRGPIADEKGFFQWNAFDQWLPLLGLPIGYDWAESPWVLLQGDSVLAWSDEEIERCFARGLVIDREATECLIHRGFGNRLGLVLGDLVSPDRSAVELYKDEEFSGIYAGRLQTIRPFCSQARIRHMKPQTDDWRSLSVLLDSDRAEVTPMVAIRQNAQGERLAFLNFAGNDPWNIFCSNRRQTQLRLLFEWVARRPLPVAVLDQPNVFPLCLKAHEHKVLALLNVSYDKTDGIRVQWWDDGVGLTWKTLERDGTWHPANVVPEQEEPDGRQILQFRGPFSPLEFHVFMAT